MSIDQILNWLRDTTQIAFWMTGASLAVLSYRNAKVSIFQPAKNEVFKVQIAELQALLKELNWKSPVDAWEKAGLASSAQISLNRNFKNFAKDQHNAEITSGMDGELVSVGGIVSPNATGFRLIKGPADEACHSDTVDAHASSWSDYKWDIFDISDRFQQVNDQLESALNNPVIPSKVLTSIEDFHKELQKSAMRAAEDMEKAVREFPRHYPTRKSLDGADLTWAHNVREERGEKLFQALNDLKKSVRDYLQSDELLGRK
ncbi:hypothetical protein [Pseudooceanicola nitratireducens]|uniref:hypothetical protein n=1 Tax=Pseudooceanicola nitratireducens TaxID=517719 RepID=UPI001C9487D0|nr:hypothetical protein [Pseudooceanicola nitratireducens]MBY6156467.1 hypothetical protein [Pseudooceanicola nitratireducens]